MRTVCTVDGCVKPEKARGFCDMHYARKRRHGHLRVIIGERGKPHLNSSGYLVVTRRGHPNADKSGRVLVHRLVMAEALGRPLRPDESVHHRNGVKTDNRLKNLELRRAFHGKGLTVDELVADAVETLRLYAPELLREHRLRGVA